MEKHIRSGAFFAHSEPLLLSLFASSDQDGRCFAVDVVLKLRGNSELRDKGVRPRKNPHLHIHATKLQDLTEWKKEMISKPIFTFDKSLEELKGFKEAPFQAPYYPDHKQSTERAVQQVSQAAASVRDDKRDGYVGARFDHKETVPFSESKKYSLKLL